MAWALRARAPVAAGSLPRATRSAPKAGALRARAPTCAPRVTAHVVSWGEWGCRRSRVLRAAREARCKACFELLPRAITSGRLPRIWGSTSGRLPLIGGSILGHVLRLRRGRAAPCWLGGIAFPADNKPHIQNDVEDDLSSVKKCTARYFANSARDRRLCGLRPASRDSLGNGASVTPRARARPRPGSQRGRLLRGVRVTAMLLFRSPSHHARDRQAGRPAGPRACAVAACCGA